MRQIEETTAPSVFHFDQPEIRIKFDLFGYALFHLEGINPGLIMHAAPDPIYAALGQFTLWCWTIESRLTIQPINLDKDGASFSRTAPTQSGIGALT
jgi:hypothetical protein